jgi:cysteine dioxygenase
MSTSALDTLVRSLHEQFHGGRVSGGRVAELMGEYALTRGDWREFALFSDEHYTRNLVVLEPSFELLILCWGAGQESPIHNHEGQDCWMAVLDGEIEEVRYPMPASGRPGPLQPKGSLRFTHGQVAFIRDEMGLHLVRPTRASGPGVTLHLYAAPYDECNCYCPDTGRVTRKKLGHHSVRGRILSAGTAGTAREGKEKECTPGS